MGRSSATLKCQELQLTILRAELCPLFLDPTPNSKGLRSPYQELISWVWLDSDSGSDSGKAVRVELALVLAMVKMCCPVFSSRTGHPKAEPGPRPQRPGLLYCG